MVKFYENTCYFENEFVRGVNAGVFVIEGFETIEDIEHVKLKEVNPKDFSDSPYPSFYLPMDGIAKL